MALLEAVCIVVEGGWKEGVNLLVAIPEAAEFKIHSLATEATKHFVFFGQCGSNPGITIG